MVARRLITLLMLLTALAAPLMAQNYSTSDTITEYPNQGTFYHDRFVGRKCASGEIFDQNKFTAAHWKIKMGTLVMVTNRNTGLQVIVKVNDRCPKRGVFDMTRRAARAIGIRGCQPVTIRILPDGYEERWKAQESMFDSVPAKHVSTPAATQKNTSSSTDNILVINHKEKDNAGSYNLFLTYAVSHGDAYGQMRHLPAAYRDRVAIESIDGLDSLRVTLDVHFTKEQAKQLLKSLKGNFPQAKIIAAE